MNKGKRTLELRAPDPCFSCHRTKNDPEDKIWSVWEKIEWIWPRGMTWVGPTAIVEKVTLFEAQAVYSARMNAPLPKRPASFLDGKEKLQK